MGQKRNRRDLRTALEAGQPVLVRRNLWKADHLEGFVVRVDREWAVLHLVVDVDLNGWTAVRLDSVRDVVLLRADAFITRALAWAGERPVDPGLDTSSVQDLLRSASTEFPVITLYTEAADPTVCAIGRPVHLARSKLRFLDVSSEAVWADEPRKLRLDDITRVDVGGRFEHVLHHLAGYPPIPE
ncbi:MAG: hypothetical protein R2746_10895 [Acidimicrobiales bacterium]|nr:hypothetical protein [Actinomycetota bacterium]